MYIQNNVKDSLKAKRRKRNLHRFFIGLFLVVIIFISFCFISNSDILEIQTIKINNNSSVSDGEIEIIVREIISKRYLGVISKKNFVLIPRREIESGLLDRYLKIADIKISLLGRNVMLIDVVGREIEAKWCDYSATGKTQCYFLDHEGFAFATVPDLFGNSILSFSNESSGDFLGKQYESPLLFSDLLAFIDSIQKINFPVTQITYNGNFFEIYLLGGGVIYFDDKQSINTTLENIQSLVQGKIIETSSDFFNKLNHLDLRYGNKVHFDFR